MKVRGTLAGRPLVARLTTLWWAALILLAPVAVSACFLERPRHGRLADAVAVVAQPPEALPGRLWLDVDPRYRMGSCLGQLAQQR